MESKRGARLADVFTGAFIKTTFEAWERESLVNGFVPGVYAAYRIGRRLSRQFWGKIVSHLVPGSFMEKLEVTKLLTAHVMTF